MISTNARRFLEQLQQETFQTFEVFATEMYHDFPIDDVEHIQWLSFIKTMYALFCLSTRSSPDFLRTYMTGLIKEPGLSLETTGLLPLQTLHPTFHQAPQNISFQILHEMMETPPMSPMTVPFAWYMYCFYHHCGGTVDHAEWLYDHVPELSQRYASMGLYDMAWTYYQDPLTPDDPHLDELSLYLP